MTESEVFFLLGMIALALWKRNQFLYFFAASVALAFGIKYIGELWYYGLPTLGIGLHLFFSAVLEFWRR